MTLKGLVWSRYLMVMKEDRVYDSTFVVELVLEEKELDEKVQVTLTKHQEPQHKPQKVEPLLQDHITSEPALYQPNRKLKRLSRNPNSG